MEPQQVPSAQCPQSSRDSSAETRAQDLLSPSDLPYASPMPLGPGVGGSEFAVRGFLHLEAGVLPAERSEYPPDGQPLGSDPGPHRSACSLHPVEVSAQPLGDPVDGSQNDSSWYGHDLSRPADPPPHPHPGVIPT